MYTLNGPIAVLLESNCYLKFEWTKLFLKENIFYIYIMVYSLKHFFSILADGIFTILIGKISGSHFFFSNWGIMQVNLYSCQSNP